MLLGERDGAGEKPVLTVYGVSDLLRGGFAIVEFAIPNIRLQESPGVELTKLEVSAGAAQSTLEYLG
jgi:hypothetical protein